MGKFKEWLKIDSYSELKPTQDMMEVLSYLAYDTVREVRSKSSLGDVIFSGFVYFHLSVKCMMFFCR